VEQTLAHTAPTKQVYESIYSLHIACLDLLGIFPSLLFSIHIFTLSVFSILACKLAMKWPTLFDYRLSKLLSCVPRPLKSCPCISAAPSLSKCHVTRVQEHLLHLKSLTPPPCYRPNIKHDPSSTALRQGLSTSVFVGSSTHVYSCEHVVGQA
jgi:hypothetical protein